MMPLGQWQKDLREVAGEVHRDAELGDTAPDFVEPVLVPGRACGTCSLCCKVYTVKELAKPAGTWCAHRASGVGCSIHASRPRSCRTFFCAWLADPNFGPEWKPEVSRFVIYQNPARREITLTVDPGMPLAW